MKMTAECFCDTKKFLNGFSSGLDICNLGSSTGKFAFDYSESGLNGANFATGPQSLLYDFKILKAHRHLLKEDAFVLIAISPFHSVLTFYREPERYWKYYPILPPEEILYYSKTTADEISSLLNNLTNGIPDEPELSADSPLPPERIKQNAENLLNCWRKEFNIADFDAPLSSENRISFQSSSETLSSLLNYCISEKLRPVLVIPPIAAILKQEFSLSFRQHYIYDFLDAANTVNAPVLDFLDDPEFEDEKQFYNSLLLNRKGRLFFTGRVLSQLRLLSMTRELRSYYAAISSKSVKLPFNPLADKMNACAEAHPEFSPMMLKASQYEIIAENFRPVLFPNNPFFFETGLKMAEYDGHSNLSSGGWLLLRNLHLYDDRDPETLKHYRAASRLGLHLVYGPYCDYDHHCFPFTTILREGLFGILKRLENAQKNCNNPEKTEFYDAARRGILAVHRIAEKFAAEADAKIEFAGNPAEELNYRRIAECARKVPWNPPETFYEGLAVLWFFHELGSTLDGVGMSVLGSPDRQLIELYRNDLKQNRLTRRDAEELVRAFLVQTDCKLQSEYTLDKQFNAAEQGDTLILGGTDENGNPVYNELTSMFLKAHRELKLIYPKIHCRIASVSPPEFLEECVADFLNGRNVISFLNDDLLIPALVKAGKTKEDAAGYVAGGCWEIITEGCEHSEGANCYFSLARAIDLSIQSTPKEEQDLGFHFDRPDTAASFGEFYEICMNNTKRALRKMLDAITQNGCIWPEVNPCPFFSACLDGCLESGMDYSAGGAKYSPHGVPFTGVAIYINSLLAVKRLCFEEKSVSLSELLNAIRLNWEDAEPLRLRAMTAPHFGDGKDEAAELGRRILDELADFVAGFKNERGGSFQCGIYSYTDIVDWALVTGATPDGRKRGDFLAQGLTPSRLHADDLPAVFRDAAALPLERFPANSVLTLSLSRSGLDVRKLADILRVWCHMKAGGMLQLNCISLEELEEAIREPEKHQELIVRLYGFSARFVSLDPKRQREFISRRIL